MRCVRVPRASRRRPVDACIVLGGESRGAPTVPPVLGTHSRVAPSFTHARSFSEAYASVAKPMGTRKASMKTPPPIRVRLPTSPTQVTGPSPVVVDLAGRGGAWLVVVSAPAAASPALVDGPLAGPDGPLAPFTVSTPPPGSSCRRCTWRREEAEQHSGRNDGTADPAKERRERTSARW